MSKFLVASKLGLALTLIVFSCQSSFSQTNSGITEASLISLFNQRLGNQIRLLNGVSYVDYSGKLDGNAYLDDNSDFIKANIVYDGVEFVDVPIIYDLVQDKIITLLPNGYTKYSLLSERLSSFIIGDSRYIYYAPNVNMESIQNAGFYKQAYQGRATILVKRSKSIKEIIDVYGARKKFTDKVEYYILHKDVLNKVTGDSDIYRILELDKSEIKKHLKSNNLKFRKDPEKTLVEAVSFYDQLSK